MFKKILDYLKSLNPANVPARLAGQDEFLPIQERILHTIYLAGSVLTLIAVVIFLPGMLQSASLLKMIFFCGLGGLLVLFTLVRNVPYTIRAETLLVLFYLVSVFAISQQGLGGNVGASFLTYIIFALIFFDIKTGLRAVLLSLGTLAFFAFAFNTNLIHPPAADAILDPTSASDWLIFGFPLIILVGLNASAIASLLRRLTYNLMQANQLSNSLKEEQKKLDRLLREGTSQLKYRELQLRTASQISRELSNVLDPKILLEKVVNSVRDNFNLYYVGIFLVDAEKRYAVLQAGTGEAGEKMLAAGHRLELGGVSMIGTCIANREARIALDVGVERVRFNNPYLPGTRSEMALPIIYQDHAIGAFTIQSSNSNAFNDEDIIILQGIADSLAIAFENARLFQRNEQALQELRMFNQASIQETWGQTLSTQGDLTFTYKNDSIRLLDGDAHTLSLPVLLREEKIGEMNLELSSETLDEDDRYFLNAIITQTALALENARMINETQRRAMQEQKLNDLSAQLSRTSSIEYILQTAARELGQLPMVSEVSVQLVSTDPGATTDRPGSNGNGKERA